MSERVPIGEPSFQSRFNPFSNEVRAGPVPVPGGLGHFVAIAADDAGGTVGACHRDAERGDVRFSLHGPDGTPLGRHVTVATGLERPMCALAAAGLDTYVVLAQEGLPLGTTTAPIQAIHATVLHVRR
jgi:hypothetical protein